MQILLSNSQAEPGRTVRQEQEEISRNHVHAFIPGSVLLTLSADVWLCIIIWPSTPKPKSSRMVVGPCQRPARGRARRGRSAGRADCDWQGKTQIATQVKGRERKVTLHLYI